MPAPEKSESRLRWITNWWCRSHDIKWVTLYPDPASVKLAASSGSEVTAASTGSEVTAASPGSEVTAATSGSEVTAAIMAHVLSRPDSIRQRALNAATISGALGAALVVAAISGATNRGGSADPWTTRLVIAAIAGFAISTLLSVYAVVFPHDYYDPKNKKARDKAREKKEAREKEDAREEEAREKEPRAPEMQSSNVPQPYQDLVFDYENYADEVRQKMRWAAATTSLAVALTALAVMWEIAGRAQGANAQVTVVLSQDAGSAVWQLCPKNEKEKSASKGSDPQGKLLYRIEAVAPADELTKPMVELRKATLVVEEPARGDKDENSKFERPCNGAIRLRRSAIRAAFAPKRK